MDMDVQKRLDKIVVKLTDGLVNEMELNDDTDLVVDAFFDSVTIIQCIVEIEAEFNIEFDDEMLQIEFVKDYKWLKEYIQKKINETNQCDNY